MVVQQFQDGGRPPFWKSIYRHISVNNHRIFIKSCTQQQILNWMNVTWSKLKKLHWTDSSLTELISCLDMHHLVFGINFQIHAVSLTILLSIHLLIHLSTHLWHHPRSRHPSLLHSYTPGSKRIFSTNPSHRIDFVYLLDCLMITGLDRTYHALHFIFSFTF